MITTKLSHPSAVEEIKILSNVRLLGRHDLNPVTSTDNLRVQFEITGVRKGSVTCYLCLDGHELTDMERNYIYPLFTEAMNILIGSQISKDSAFRGSDLRLSPPKISLIPVTVETSRKSQIHKYELELTTISFTVLTEYNLETLN